MFPTNLLDKAKAQIELVHLTIVEDLSQNDRPEPIKA
jgi:hypothetical protein